MAVFDIGDQVEALDDNFRGRVVAIAKGLVTVSDMDGFTMEFKENQLVRIPKSSQIKVSFTEALKVKLEKDAPIKKGTTVPKRKERNAPKMEVDLHIHQLVKSTHGLSNYELLNIQLETAKRQLEFAMRKRIQKVVFIHGVGEGVLREELNYLFGRYENLKWYDADYQKYGQGATEVYIFQNP